MRERRRRADSDVTLRRPLAVHALVVLPILLSMVTSSMPIRFVLVVWSHATGRQLDERLARKAAVAAVAAVVVAVAAYCF